MLSTDVHESPCYQRKRERELQGADFLIWKKRQSRKVVKKAVFR
jgi:hypothetical protein